MKFYTLEEVPNARDDRVFKASPVGKAIVTTITYGLAVAALVAALEPGKPLGISHGAFYFFAVVFALFGLIPLGYFRASLRPTNWLMRCNSSGVILKYRAYENWKLPADSVQAVALDYSEIAWARLVKETRVTQGMDRRNANTTSFLTYIALGLANPDTAALEKHLADERNLRPDGRMVTLDYPVQVRPGGIVEIRWTGGITPSARQALEYLSRQQVKITDEEKRHTDLTHHRDAQPADEQAKIIDLIKSGDEMAAIELARRAYGYSLTDATSFVQKLAGRDHEDEETGGQVVR